MNLKKRVIVFGFDEEKAGLIRRNLPSQEYECMETDAVTDLIAILATTLVINADQLTEKERVLLWEFYSEIECCTDETVLWCGQPYPPAELQKTFKCYSSFDAITVKLKYLLLEAHRKCRKTAEFSKSIMYALMILSEIRKHPGISTKALSEQCETSPRSIQRYIETLRCCGEWIDYDCASKGWRLTYGGSALLGECFEEE